MPSLLQSQEDIKGNEEDLLFNFPYTSVKLTRIFLPNDTAYFNLEYKMIIIPNRLIEAQRK